MKTTVSLYEFSKAFQDADRKDNFSYEGLAALFDYFEEFEEGTGEEVELDVIAFCCEYSEYESLEEYNQNYEPVDSIEDIEKLTTVIPIDEERFIIQDY